MNTTARRLLSAGLLFCATIAHAEFIVDTKYAGSAKNSSEITWDESHEHKYAQFEKKWDDSLLKSIADDNEGIAPSSRPPGMGQGHILWNGRHYYAWAATYLSAQQDREITAAVSQKRKSLTLPGGGVCALYVFDQDLHKIGSLKIDLPENNHGTWCNGVYGFGGAGKSVEGVLVTISYYLTGKKPAQRAEDIGRGWRYMTTLIRFEERGGELLLRQDDTCLGNPNNYDTIASARKALTKCAKISANHKVPLEQ